MIPELGNFSLICALLVSVMLASVKPKARLVYLQFGLICLSVACLTYSFVTDDFTVRYVASNSSKILPLGYKLTGIWGSHEGSMLLWVFMLAIWTLAVCFKRHALPERIANRVLAILGMISFGFLLFILATSNPFLRILENIPLEGRDLNPLLQDPGYLFHPPLLYVGYVGFAVTFALSLACLIEGELDARWARWSRPWTLTAWSFLTLGIVLGSWWAYRVLGWGGWWFWDPVENASFMPWLVGTALLHSLIVTEKRDTFKAWTVFLAIASFALSLLGTFLVRSGVLTSVHAFATDPTRGFYMLIFLSIVVGSSLLIYALRAPKVHRPVKLSVLSRESALLTNNIFLATAMFTVLLGTLYPLIIDALGMGKLSVGAPYFNWVFVPLMTPVIILMGIAPHLRWQSMAWSRLPWVFIGVFTIAVIISSYYSLMGVVFTTWLVILTLYKVRQHSLGMILAHLGIAMAVLGITVSTQYSIQQDLRFTSGQQAVLGAYTVKLAALTDIKGPNYTAVDGAFEIYKNQKPIANVHSQKRQYDLQPMALTNSGIHATFWRDIYIALAEPLGNNAWAVRIYYKPLVRFIWLGGLFIFAGGLVAAWRRW